MRNRSDKILALLLMMMLGTVSLLAQNTSVKGKVIDQNGQPVVGATVELVGKQSGRKYNLQTDKSGQYFSLGIGSDTYQLTLKKGGQVLYQDTFPVTLSRDTNEFNIDLAKAAKGGTTLDKVDPSKLTAEQKKALEEYQKKAAEAQKENAKIKNLNEMLAQAREAETAGNYDQAISILAQATQVDAAHDILWGALGSAYLGAKKYPEAGDAYQKAIQIISASPTPNPKQQEALAAYYNNLGQSYGNQRPAKVPEAVAAYETAAKTDPTKAAQYYFNEGAVLTNAGKTDDANVAFDKTIAADPNRAEAYYQKGINLLQKATMEGDKMKAPPGTAEAFNKYLELDPNGRFADNAKQMLTVMGSSIATSFGKTKKK